jgi:hypothetical protein
VVGLQQQQQRLEFSCHFSDVYIYAFDLA